MQPATVTLPDLEAGLTCRRIEDAIKAPTLTMAKNTLGTDQTLATLGVAITKAMVYFAPNRRMNGAQVALFAEEILDRYPYESVADVALFMRGAATGKYGRKGQEGETFGQLDMQRLFIWFGEYLEEKAFAMERGEHVMQQRDEQQAREIIGAVPGLQDAVKEFVVSAKEASDLVTKRNRIAKLAHDVPGLTDDGLRECWKIYRLAEERTIIQAEAARRGLLGEELKAAQLEIDANDTTERQAYQPEPRKLSSHVDALKAKLANDGA